MKMILVLLTKAGKISKILGYIYTGLLAAESALEIVLKSLSEDKAKKLKKIIKFITVGADALKTILGWLGKEDLIRDAENEAKEMTSAEFSRKMALEFNETTRKNKKD